MSDDTKLYRLVFTGNILPGNSKNKVISRLQQMLHLDKEKATRLVAGKHKQINKKLTLDRAEKLRLLILKQGAECVLLPIEESFVSTQQLPMFIRNGDGNSQENSPAGGANSAGKASAAVVPKESISRIRQRSKPLSTNTKLKYFIYVIFIMVVEGLLIWNFKPVAQVLDCQENKQDVVSIVEEESIVLVKPDIAKKMSPEATETTEKIRNISVRTTLWFADQGKVTSPADVSWIWIQGDIGISVTDMNDSWGNAIRYSGKEDRFEIRSSGPDKRFYTADDLFREMII